jgi:hypothetical protein
MLSPLTCFKGSWGQVTYNGINAAYMSFALGSTDYDTVATEVLAACEKRSPTNYWIEATRADKRNGRVLDSDMNESQIMYPL